MKTHYSGGIVYANGNRLPGWPCCCTGDKAVQIRKQGNQTDEPDDVTCKACNALIDKQVEYRKAHFKHWWDMHRKGYCR